MKRQLLLITLFTSFSAWGQSDFKSYSQTYSESKFGASLLSEKELLGGIWPGLSGVIGRKKFYSRGKFTDAQIGSALPTFFTAKIGVGKYNFNKKTSSSVGLRIWPTHIYIQHSRPTHLLSEKRISRIKKRESRIKKRESRIIEKYPDLQIKKSIDIDYNAICGEWNFSIEVGAGNIPPTLSSLSFFSVAIITIGHRIYID